MDVKNRTGSKIGIRSTSNIDRSCDGKAFENFFHDHFDSFFARSETRQQALDYVQSLLLKRDQASSGTNSRSATTKLSKSTQRLFFGAQWDEDAVCDELQTFVAQSLGDETGMCFVGETCFQKKGDKSVGVESQFNRAANKTQNCQVCLFLGYSSSRGSTFLDRRLYLPKSWAMDQKRRLEAKIPEDIEYRSKSDLALEMLQSARARGLPIRWVISDEPFCSDTNLRDMIHATGMNYILPGHAESAFKQSTLADPEIESQTSDSGNTPSQHSLSTLTEIVSSWPEKKWKCLIDNSKGDEICVFDWARERICEHRDDTAMQEIWLLARRAMSQRCDTAYFLSNASADISLQNLAKVACDLGKLNQIVAEARIAFGLDDYGVRHWHSWHRHITLSMMAHVWWVYLVSAASDGSG